MAEYKKEKRIVQDSNHLTIEQLNDPRADESKPHFFQ